MSAISEIFLSWTSSADLLDQVAAATLLHLVGQLGDDDRLFALRERLDVGAGLHAHAPPAGRISVADAVAPKDDPARRKVRALHVAHQAVDVDRRVVHVCDPRDDRLAQVVRRDVRRHADRDPGRAVDE